MKIIKQSLLNEFAAVRKCEWCGKHLYYPANPHHVFTRGFGGGGRLDIRINIVALGGPWDCGCHQKHHDGHEPYTEQLLAVVAKREKITEDAIVREVARLRRTPK